MNVCGQVTKLKNGMAYVVTGRPVSCEGCSNAGICSRESVEIIADNRIGAQVGDTVEVETDENRVSLWIAAYIFLIPVAILFAGTFLFSIHPWLVTICIPLSIIYFLLLKVFNANWRPVNIIVGIKDK